MGYIYQIEDIYSCVDVFCVSSCEKNVDPSWLGYKFYSNVLPIKQHYYVVCSMSE